MTGLEVGAQLFLRPRTIDYHLPEVFAKRKITARADPAGVGLGERVSA